MSCTGLRRPLHGKVKSHIVSEGIQSGTRCWGRELNIGKIIYVVDVTVHKVREMLGSLDGHSITPFVRIDDK